MMEYLKSRSIEYSLRYLDGHKGYGQTDYRRDLALPQTNLCESTKVDK